MNKYIRWSLTTLGIVVIVVIVSWVYTKVELASTLSKGTYTSPEAGMLALADKYYAPDKEVTMLYAGPNSSNGSQPHVWYVIAEVRASARADGSEMGNNGCDAPGSYFLQTKEENIMYIAFIQIIHFF